MQNNKKTTVSIIVPILNEENNLPTLYDSIRLQELSADIILSELIAVDNGSTDNSVAISRLYCSDVFIRPDDTIADLRNFGAKHSTGDILIFMDADCILCKDVIQNVVLLLNDKVTTAVGPDGLIPIGNSTWVQNTWYLHTKVLSSEIQSIEVENLSSGFFAIKATNYAMIGGFDGSLTIGEDSDISRKLRDKGFKLIKSNRLLVYTSGHPKTVKKFIQREYWHGDSFCHLLIHKRIDLLTIYFIANAVAIAIAFVVLIYYLSVLLSILILSILCVVPFIKAVKKDHKIDAGTVRLFIIYFLYVNSRTAALFKLR